MSRETTARGTKREKWSAVERYVRGDVCCDIGVGLMIWEDRGMIMRSMRLYVVLWTPPIPSCVLYSSRILSPALLLITWDMSSTLLSMRVGYATSECGIHMHLWICS